MKKIIWILFLITIGLSKVSAKTYYSEYQLLDNQGNVYEESDTLKKETYKLFRWYEKAQVERNRLYDGTEGRNCYEERGPWQKTRISESVYRSEEVLNTYNYDLAKGVQYIHLDDLQGSYGSFRVTELEVTYNGQKIDYNYTCNGCWENFDKYINNGIWDENESYIDNNGSLTIDLNQEYPVHLINVTFYLFDLGTDQKKYTISYSNSYSSRYSKKEVVLGFSDVHWSNAKKISHYVYDLGLTDWKVILVTNSEVTNGYAVALNGVESEYRYVDKYCTYDDIIDQYFDGYYEYPPTLTAIKGNEYIEKDRFYFRDKIELKDELIIKSNEYDLNDFVINSTTEYTLSSNLDSNINGIYELTIKTPYKTIIEDIVVDNPNNTINEQQIIIDNLNKEITILKENLETIAYKMAEQKEKYEKEISRLESEIELLKQNCQTCNDELDKLIKEKEQLILDYEETILNLSNQINDIQVELGLKENIIDNLELENDELKEKIEQIKQSALSLNEKIINEYNEKIVKLQTTNDTFKDKINELTNIINSLNNSIKDVVMHEQEIVNYYENELITSNLKFEQLSNEKNELKNEQVVDSEKDYLLKIERQDIVNNWYIIVLIVLLLFILYKTLRNKSK